jgi:lipopolysaccharide transport system permease protein
MFISNAHLVSVFFTKLTLNLKSEAAKTYLSYIWWVLEPALLVAVFYVVFEIFLNRSAPNFLVFLICGKIPFLWFSKSVTNASNSIQAGRGLINQVALPMPFFPLLTVFQDAIKQCVVFVFMLVFVAMKLDGLSWTWLQLIPVVLSQFLLISSMALVVAAITPYVPDFKYLIATGMVALMFGSGIFYSYKDVIRIEHQELFLLNPVANLIKNYRQVLMDGVAPDYLDLVTISLISIGLLALMSLYYRKFGKSYARIIAQ